MAFCEGHASVQILVSRGEWIGINEVPRKKTEKGEDDTESQQLKTWNITKDTIARHTMPHVDGHLTLFF